MTAPTDRTAGASPRRPAVPRQPAPAGAEPGPHPPCGPGSPTPAAPAFARGHGAAGPDPGEGGPLVITVLGTPGPQGSKKHVGNGVMIESSKKVAPWRARVEVAARDQAGPGWAVLDGPLRVEFVFSLPRGKTVRRAHHTTYPDLSKLIRSTEDALTRAKIWADDARIVAYHQPRKAYAGDPGADVLPEPGAVIRIWKITPEGTT